MRASMKRLGPGSLEAGSFQIAVYLHVCGLSGGCKGWEQGADAGTNKGPHHSVRAESGRTEAASRSANELSAARTTVQRAATRAR